MKFRKGVLTIITAFLTILLAGTAWAEIGNVAITITDNLEAGAVLEPNITVSSAFYEIESQSWAKSSDSWKAGSKVRGTVTLAAEGGSTFAAEYHSGECSIQNGNLIQAQSADGGHTLVVDFYYVPVRQLGIPEKAGWTDTAKTTATWKKVSGASAYQVKLYGDGLLIKTLTVNSTKCDLSSYMTYGINVEYNYEVRAVAADTQERKYLLDGEYQTSENATLEDGEEYSGRWENYREGNRYRKEDGTYYNNGWQLILDRWYYFTPESYAVMGWNQIAGTWYYMDNQSVMQTGWVLVNDSWYYLGPDGAMQTGWVESRPGNWYYLNADGSMAVNTVIDGYPVNADGLWTKE